MADNLGARDEAGMSYEEPSSGEENNNDKSEALASAAANVHFENGV